MLSTTRKELIKYIRENDQSYTKKQLEECYEGELVIIKTSIEIKLAKKEQTAPKEKLRN